MLPSAGGNNPELKLSQSYQVATAMKVFKNLFGRGDKIHVDEIAVAPGLLLGGAVIVDEGINANGEWTRWGNGWQMVCGGYNLGNIAGAGAGTWANPYRTPVTRVDFPKSFIVPPFATCTLSVDSPDYNRRMGSVAYRETTTEGITAIQAYRIGNRSESFDAIVVVIAIGRWK